MNGIRRLIREIHRRSLWQVLGVYLVGSWVGYQVILSLTDGLGLPDWVPPFAIVLFIIGLPIVVATAIVQEGVGGRNADSEALAGEASHEGVGTGAPTPEASRQEGVETGAPAAQASPGEGIGAGAPARQAPRQGRIPVAALFTWSRAVLAGVISFVLLGTAAAGYVGMRTMGIGPIGSLVARGVLDEREPILLADFRNGTPDADLGSVVTASLRIDLVQSPAVTVAEPENVRDALLRMGRDPATPLTTDIARELAVREGMKAVLTGEIGVAGDGFVLTATLVAAEGGATLAAFRETARDAGGLIDAIDRLSRQVRERVGEPLRSIRSSEPLSRVTTGSLDALRLYSRARRHAAQSGDFIGAVRLLEEAVELDDAFAAAHLSMAIYLANVGIERTRAIDAITRAYELRDRLTPLERNRATAFYFDLVAPDPDRAIRAWEAILERQPDNRDALNGLALALRDAGQYERAEQLLRRAAETGQWAGYDLNLVRTLVDQGRLEEATELAETAWHRFTGHPHAYRARITAAIASTDWHRAIEHATAMYDAAGTNLSMRAGALLMRRDLFAVLGRWTDATRDTDALTALAEGTGLAAETLLTRIMRANLRTEPWVRPDAAIATLEADLVRFPLDSMAILDRPWGALAAVYMRAGRLDEAERYLELFTNTENQRAPSFALQLRGAIATRRGRPQEAIEHFERIERDPGGCRTCHLPEMGLAWEAAGRPGSAIEVYERYLATPPAPGAGPFAEYRPLVLLRVADLHAANGDRARAAARLAEFVELWRDADPELQPHVAAARQRLEALLRETPGSQR